MKAYIAEIFILFFIFAGCRSDEPGTVDAGKTAPGPVAQFSCRNMTVIEGLSPGMSKEEVIARLGSGSVTADTLVITNPYRSQTIRGKEVVFYYTKVKKEDGRVTDDELTPLIFENGRLTAIGYCGLPEEKEAGE